MFLLHIFIDCKCQSSMMSFIVVTLTFYQKQQFSQKFDQCLGQLFEQIATAHLYLHMDLYIKQFYI